MLDCGWAEEVGIALENAFLTRNAKYAPAGFAGRALRRQIIKRYPAAST
jgi:hypothetical protein